MNENGVVNASLSPERTRPPPGAPAAADPVDRLRRRAGLDLRHGRVGRQRLRPRADAVQERGDAGRRDRDAARRGARGRPVHQPNASLETCRGRRPRPRAARLGPRPPVGSARRRTRRARRGRGRARRRRSAVSPASRRDPVDGRPPRSRARASISAPSGARRARAAQTPRAPTSPGMSSSSARTGRDPGAARDQRDPRPPAARARQPAGGTLRDHPRPGPQGRERRAGAGPLAHRHPQDAGVAARPTATGPRARHR